MRPSPKTSLEIRERIWRHIRAIAIDDGFYGENKKLAAAVQISISTIKLVFAEFCHQGVIDVVPREERIKPVLYRILRPYEPDNLPARPKRTPRSGRIAIVRPEPIVKAPSVVSRATIRLVPPGTYPARGFSMIGGRVV